MSRRKKNREDSDLFLQYARDGMKGKERNAFEKKLQKNPFDAEAAEGFSLVSSDEAKEDLRILHDSLRRRTARRKPFYLIRVAALITILLATSIVLVIFRPEKQSLISENVSSENKNGSLSIAASRPISKASNDEDIPLVAQAGKKENATRQGEPSHIDNELPGVAKAEQEVTAEMAANEAGVSREIVPDAVVGFIPSRSKAAVLPVGKISGTVISADDQLPLPGVTIALQGKVSGVAISDVNGKFSFDINTDSALKLMVSSIGMIPTEISATKGSDLLIAMNYDITDLNEVVVVDYGVSRKSRQTGAVSTISADEEKNNYNYTSAAPAAGTSAFRKYIESNIQYPSGSTERTKEVVVVSMIVRIDGSIDSLQVVKSPGKAFSDEALRLINEGPSWIPGKLNGIPQEEVVKIRMVFK